MVERANRVPTGACPLGALPWPFLVRFLNYRDFDMLLAEARKQQDLKFEKACAMFFPDFSAETQRKRRSFTDVRRWLRDKKINTACCTLAGFIFNTRDQLRFLIPRMMPVTGWMNPDIHLGPWFTSWMHIPYSWVSIKKAVGCTGCALHFVVTLATTTGCT